MDFKSSTEVVYRFLLEIENSGVAITNESTKAPCQEIKEAFNKLNNALLESTKLALGIFGTSRSKNGLLIRDLYYRKIILNKNKVYFAYCPPIRTTLKESINETATVLNNSMHNRIKNNNVSDSKVQYKLDYCGDTLNKCIEELIIEPLYESTAFEQKLNIEKDIPMILKSTPIFRDTKKRINRYGVEFLPKGQYIFDIYGNIKKDQQRTYYVSSNEYGGIINYEFIYLYNEGQKIKNQIIKKCNDITESLTKTIEKYKQTHIHKLILLGL